jgi:hypothetical protein
MSKCRHLSSVREQVEVLNLNCESVEQREKPLYNCMSSRRSRHCWRILSGIPTAVSLTGDGKSAVVSKGKRP